MLSLSDLGLIGLFIGNFLAATIVPFSSDALYIGALAAMGRPWECFVVATAGNWLGSVATYYCGLIAKWEWLERTFRIEPQTIARQKPKIDRFGTWLALLAWVPFVGDMLVLALGFYRTPKLPTFVLLLIGKAGRFLVWTALIIH
ncbi:MAG: DedA family protein [Salinivirgaceae bacterium]|nr:DedA family protein [Salinivirgaceae bacterium]